MSSLQENSGPIFIVGMNGSGTTMLLDCLGRHSQLYAFHKEVRLIPYILKEASRFNTLRTADDRAAYAHWILSLPVFAAVAAETPPAAPTLGDCPADAAAVLDRVFHAFAASAGKVRWAEKSPQNAQHIARLAGAFKDARFVHVLRDGRDAAASFQRRWLRDPQLTIYRWKKVVQLARRDGQQLGAQRYLEVTYETLTAQPEQTLREICEFLALPFEPVVLESSRPYLDAPGESGQGISVNSGRWKKHFSASTLQRLEGIAGNTLAEFGYTPANPEAAGDADLGKGTLRWLRSKDAVRQFLREIRLKLKGEIARPWSVILAKPLGALRQRGENTY
ncbi:MAG: sulfotransferase [Pseudomonadota bacterium]